MPEPLGTLEDGGIHLLAGKDPDPPGTGRMLDDLDTPAHLLRHSFLPSTGVASIHPHLLQSREQAFDRREQQLDSSRILDVGYMYHYLEQEAGRVHQQMPFAAAEFLGAIVAVGTAALGRFYGLVLDV